MLSKKAILTITTAVAIAAPLTPVENAGEAAVTETITTAAAPLTPVGNAGDAAVTETSMTTTTPIPIVRQEMTVENGIHKNR